MTDNTQLWALWKQLKSFFPVWSLLPSSLNTPGAWGYAGVDFLSGFRKNPSTIRSFALLDGVAAETGVVMGYLTIPLSVMALLAELAGDSVMTFIKQKPDLTLQIVFVATLGPAMYLMSHWRSRQIVSVLDLIRIERGQAPFTALELRAE